MTFLEWLFEHRFFSGVLLVGMALWLMWDIKVLKKSIPQWLWRRADFLCRLGQKMTTFGLIGFLLEGFIQATKWQLPFLALFILTFVLTSMAIKFHKTFL